MLKYDMLIEMLVDKLTTEEEKRSVRNLKTAMSAILLNMLYNEQYKVHRSIDVNLNQDDFMLHSSIMADLFTCWEEDWLGGMFLPTTLDQFNESQDLYHSRRKELVAYLVKFYADLSNALNNAGMYIN